MIACASERLHTLVGIRRNPSLSRKHVIQFQQRKLQFLVRHAYDQVPYYRELFDNAGVHPNDIRRVEDLQRLPVTDKATLRERPQTETIAAGIQPKKLIARITTGSTGEPTRVRRTGFEDNLMNLFRARALRLYGRKLRDRTVYVRSAPALSDRLPLTPNSFLAPMGIMQYRVVDCLRGGEEVARDVAEAAPDVISGYPGAIAEAATHLRRVDADGWKPRLIAVGGEVLTPAMRARIGRAFGAPVYDIYGCHEFNTLAWECPVTSELHICDDGVVVEILKDGRPVKPGESGSVVVTGLHCYSAPLIRYDLGDIATRGTESCACGLPFATMLGVRGRTMDFCILPGGQRMHHWELIPMSFWDMNWYRRYQLVQETARRFVLRIVADGEAPPDDLEQLEREITAKLGPNMEFRLDLVAAIAWGEGGKHRACVVDFEPSSTGSS